MFHNQYLQSPEDSVSSTLNPHSLDLPFDLSNLHTTQNPYPINTAQQSGYNHLTHAGIYGTTPASQNARDSSQFHYASPDTAPLGTPRYWRDFPTNDMVLHPQGLFDPNNQQLPTELSNSSQGSLGFLRNDFVIQAPNPRQSSSPATPPLEGNGPRPRDTKSDDRASYADTPRPRNTPGLRQGRGYKIEKTRHPTRQSKKNVAPSKLGPSKGLQIASPPVPGQQNPDTMTICIFYIWMAKNPGVMPTEHEMLCFSILSDDSFETVRNWFLRNVSIHQDDDDTGYQTMTNSNVDVGSASHRRQSRCNRKTDKLRSADTGYVLIERDEAQPYACTSRCGKKFGNKAGWKRHEETNHPPKGWRCRFVGCRNERKCVYFRRDKFGRHLRKAHPTLNVTKSMIDSCCVPIKPNFSRYCLFHHCDEEFKNWKERIDHIGDHLKNDRWDVSQWRQADDEREESEDADDSDSEESSDSDLTGDDDDHSDDSDADSGLDHSNSRREASSGPYARGFGSSRGQRGQGSQRRLNGGTSNDLSGYQCSISHCSPDLVISDSVPTWYKPSALPNLHMGASSSGALSRSHAQSTITDDKSTEPSSLVEAVLGPSGRGSRASVHEVMIKGYNWTVARKMIQPSSSRRLYREARIMARFNHPHITRLIGNYEDASSMTLLVLPVADCDLSQYLSRCSLGLSSGEEIRDWFNCLACGLNHIHAKGVRHRDVKPSNILVKNNGFLYSDFGSSNLVADEESIRSESADFTEQYAAPEVYRGERGRAADIWSLACVFLEIATCLLRQPVEDLRTTKRQRLKSTAYPALDLRSWQWATEWSRALRLQAADSSTSSDISFVLEVCEAMMRLRPEQRLTAAEISERFAPYRCCQKEPKTGSEKNRKLESLPESHEAYTARDGNVIPQIMPALVTSSEANKQSDLGHVDTASLNDNAIPKLPRDPSSGHVKSAITIVPADTYSIPWKPDASCESMIQRYQLEIDTYRRFLVSDESPDASRANMKKQEKGEAVELTNVEFLEESVPHHEGQADSTDKDLCDLENHLRDIDNE